MIAVKAAPSFDGMKGCCCVYGAAAQGSPAFTLN